MNIGRFAGPALIAVLVLAPGAAFATAKIYDMTPLINEPNPFQPAVPPAYRPAPVPPPPQIAPAPQLRRMEPPRMEPPMTSAPPAPRPPSAPVASAPSPPPSMPAAPARVTPPTAPTPLLVPRGREPMSDAVLIPVGRLSTDMTPQR